MRACLALFILLALGGCSIKQNVTPATLATPASNQICMIPAQGLREGFHSAYREQLQQKGFAVIEKAPGSSTSSCPLATAYTANWAWDLAMYMVYADIRVFQDGRQVGHANYDAKMGGGRLDKFIDAEAKIAELTQQLFPTGAPRPQAGAPAVPEQGAAPLSREAYRQQQVEQLMREGLSYEEYQRRYRQIMAD